MGLADEEGERYSVRAPVSPREVARLLQLFHESNLQVTFSPEHEFLLALDAKDDGHRRPVLPAGDAGADPHGEDGGGAQAPRPRASPTA